MVKNNETLALRYFLEHDKAKSSDLVVYFEFSGVGVSAVTVKRLLSSLVDRGFLEVGGAGPATAYRISVLGRLQANIDAHEYCQDDPDSRYGLDHYNFDLFLGIPSTIFETEEIQKMNEATDIFRTRRKHSNETMQKKELERFVIELSWKSSKIEGNTYSILETERLIKDGIKSPDHTTDETMMILGHKKAFQYVLENKSELENISSKTIQEIHSLLTEGQGIGRGFRSGLVGITGSKYCPLDNQFQINEAVENMIEVANRMDTPYDKALIVLLGISYIQPFEDGNKRTARMVANAILLANDCAPLSYRSVDLEEYREAVLVFYELNCLTPFKKLFIEQYIFAAENYAV